MKKNISNTELRKFGIFVGSAFIVLLGFLIPYLNGHSFASFTLFIGIPLIFIGLIKPSLLSKVYKFWISLGHFLGWINSHLILGLVFIIILQPIAYFMRIFGYDPLRKTRKNKQSYREINEERVIDLTRIF